MDTDDFPIEPVRIIVFPCFLVHAEGNAGVALHPFGKGFAVVLLTDEDSLNRYRHDIGLPERGAMRFTTPQQLLTALQSFPHT